MDNLGLLVEGFGTALTPANLLFALLGVLLGTAVGVLPGLSVLPVGEFFALGEQVEQPLQLGGAGLVGSQQI